MTERDKRKVDANNFMLLIVTTLFLTTDSGKSTIRPERAGYFVFLGIQLDRHPYTFYRIAFFTFMDSAKHYRFIEHTADLGVVVYGEDSIDLFQKAAEVLMDLMLGVTPHGNSSPLTISVSGDDLEDLMVRWLGEILYLFEGEGLVMTGAHVDDITPGRIRATLETIPFDPERHDIFHAIKAVTYHQLYVGQKADRWEARIIFDV
jgi:SHS2 domain-containing protein